MSTKASLTVILKAGDTVVAEVENPVLWQQVLAAINQSAAKGAVPAVLTDTPVLGTKPGSQNAAARFAESLGVTEQEIVGALDPSAEAPYLHLNRHCWAAMKKATPQRGVGAINPAALAGTLLALWFKEAGIEGSPTQALALDVLKTIEVVDKNPSRGIRNTKWLQARAGGVIVVNAAEITKAQEIAKAFCTKTWSETTAA